MPIQFPAPVNQLNLPAIDRAVQNNEWNALRMEGERQRQDVVGKQQGLLDEEMMLKHSLGLAKVASEGLASDPSWYAKNHQNVVQKITELGLDASSVPPATVTPEEAMKGFAEMGSQVQTRLESLMGEESVDPRLVKDAAGYQRFASGPNFGDRAFPDANAPPPGQSGGVTGSLQEVNAINADRVARGLEPISPESYLAQRRQTSADMQRYNQYLAEVQKTGGTPMSERDYAAARAGEIAGSKTTGSGMAQRQLDIPSAFALHNQTTQNFTRLYDAVDTLESNENLWKAVGLTKSMAAIPGQDGADARAAITNIKSQVGFMVLQDMRNASKTGGALGQVSEKENELLQANLAALDENMSPKAFRQSLRTIKDYLTKAQERLEQSWSLTYPELDTMGRPKDDPYIPATGQTVSIPENDPSEAVLNQARMALNAGKSRAAVEEMLESMGIDKSRL